MNSPVACNICKYTSNLLIDLGKHPLSLVSLKNDPQESKNLDAFEIKVYKCDICNHCHNAAFNPDVVPYSGDSCKMWNLGKEWREHVETIGKCVRYLNSDHYVEIGAGDGSFLDSLHTDKSKLLAIDPCDDVEFCGSIGIPYIKDYFKPSYLPKGKNCVIMRHLLEHMEDPKKFLKSIIKEIGIGSHIAIEVPCIENALANERIEDWTYEHPQHFTKLSLELLAEACGLKIAKSFKSYGGEVAFLLGEVTDKKEDWYEPFSYYRKYLKDHNEEFVYWGGAGKSSMFIRLMDLPEDALVVDSDKRKQGYYVPGTSIKIRSPEVLLDNPRKNVVATTSWRANDIKTELERYGISYSDLYVFKNRKFIEV